MWKDRESGQSIIIIVLSIMAILALVALVVDVGNAYAHRRLVQNACDAAALAGARQLAEQGVDGQVVLKIQVLSQIETFAEENGLARNKVRAWFINKNGDRLSRIYPSGDPVAACPKGVEVVGNLPFNTYFAHLLGFRTMTASTTAKAWVLSGPCSGSNLFPLTVSTSLFPDTALVPPIGKTYTLWEHEDQPAPDDGGWLYWEDGDGTCRSTCTAGCGPSDDVLRENILDTSCSGDWEVGDWVRGKPSGPSEWVLEALFPYVTDGVEVIIPLYDQVDGTGSNTKYEIGGFAAFELTCVYGSKDQYEERDGGCAPCIEAGSNKCIRGQVVALVEPGGVDGCVETGIVIPSFRQPAPAGKPGEPPCIP